MSGYELESQQLLQELPDLKQSTNKETTEEVNRALLKQLQQSKDIAYDLAVLLGQRPYMYARVMQRLNGVLGNPKVRTLHNMVQAKARDLKQRLSEDPDKVVKDAIAAVGSLKKSVSDSKE